MNNTDTAQWERCTVDGVTLYRLTGHSGMLYRVKDNGTTDYTTIGAGLSVIEWEPADDVFDITIGEDNRPLTLFPGEVKP